MDASESTLALLATVNPGNTELVSRWAAALQQVGGIYDKMDEEGRLAMARATIGTLSKAVARGVPRHTARRYVEPPPYRDQPIDEFVTAGLSVSRMLRRYLREQAASEADAHAAYELMEQVLNAAMLQVVRLRQKRGSAGRFAHDVGGYFSRQCGRETFNNASERIAAEIQVDLCLLCSVDDREIHLLGSSHPVERHGLESRRTVQREALEWLDELDDHSIWRDLDSAANPIEGAFTRDGFTGARARPLRAGGRLVGLLVLLTKSGTSIGDHTEQLAAVEPLLSAQVGLVVQASALERAEAAMDELFDDSPNMLCTVDRLGRVLRTNMRFREQIGVPSDVVGMPLSWMVHPSWLERFTHLWREIVSQPKVDQGRVDLITARSDRLPLALEAHWLRDEVDPPRTCMIALWNVSEQVKRQAQAQHRIDELTAFAHHIAHDLKAPLRTVAGFSAILAEEMHDPTGELREYTERIEAAAQRGDELITGLLRFAHSTEGMTGAQVVTLEELVRHVKTELAVKLQARAVQLEIDLDQTPLIGYRVPLETLVTNLISNAVRYSPGPAPKVSIGTRAESPGWAVLYVRDDGIGIPTHALERIFELFRRVHTDVPGSGVGLAIVRRIARGHGGDVSVHSIEGQGSTFEVRLPRP